MGTRAIITKEGKPFIATHWDGYPESLGKDLKKMPDLTNGSIIAVAKEHSIDFADNVVRKVLNKERIKELAQRHNLSEAEIKQGYRRGNIMSSDDFEIGNIKIYDDWAEFQYDIRDGKIYYRALSGSWLNAKKDGRWKRLTPNSNPIE